MTKKYPMQSLPFHLTAHLTRFINKKTITVQNESHFNNYRHTLTSVGVSKFAASHLHFGSHQFLIAVYGTLCLYVQFVKM
jgi:hypothetical protein